MTFATRLVTCLIGALLMVPALSACGGDDGDSASDSSSEATDGQSADEDGGSSGDEPSDEPTGQPDDAASGGDYCDALKSTRDRLEALEGEGGGLADFDEAIGALREVADDAPADVSADWEVMIGGFDTLVQALDEAGVRLEDLADPEALGDIDPEAMQQLQEELEALDSKKFEQAANSISQHARSECGFDLDAG